MTEVMTEDGAVSDANQVSADLPATVDEGLEDGELYVCRKGKLERIPRDDFEGVRKIRITEDAYEAAMSIAKEVRTAMLGWRPDATLVVSALVMEKAKDVQGSSKAVTALLAKLLAGAEN